MPDPTDGPIPGRTRGASEVAKRATAATRATLTAGWGPPWPVGPTLVLRPWVVADAFVLAAAWDDAEVARWNPVPSSGGPAGAGRWIASGAARRRAGVLDLAVVLRGCGAVVGEVGVVAAGPGGRFAELGWWVAPAWRRRGHGAAAVALVVAWIRPGSGIDRVFARMDPANAASKATARRAGLVQLGTAGAAEVWANPLATGAGPPGATASVAS